MLELDHTSTSLLNQPFKENTSAVRKERLFNTPKKMLTQYTATADKPPQQPNYTINPFGKGYMYASTSSIANCAPNQFP